MKFLIFFFTVISSFFVQRANCNTVELLEHLLKNYKHKVRPVVNETTVVQLKHEIVPRRILYVSEIRQEIKVYFWTRMEWHDEFLTWDPQDFNGTTTVFIPAGQLWHPDIVLYQSNENQIALNTADSIPRIVSYNGEVVLLTPIIYTAHCKMNLTFYPFDTQVCYLKFGSWAYDGLKVNISSRVKKAESSSYLHNGEWDLKKLTVERHEFYYSCCPEPYPDVEYTLYLSRRPMFYVMNLITPFIAITLLSSFVFIIPPDSGEKISLAVTTLLSLVVFTQLVMSTVPAASDGTHPVIGVYFVVSVVLVSIVVVCSVFSLHAFHKKNSGLPVPYLLRLIVLDFMGTICRKLHCLHFSNDTDGYNVTDITRRTSNRDAEWSQEIEKVLNSDRVIDDTFRNRNEINTVSNEHNYPSFIPRSLRRGGTNERVSASLSLGSGSTSASIHRMEKIIAKMEKYLREEKRRVNQEKHFVRNSKEWVEISRILDRFFLVCFMAIHTILPTIMLLKCIWML